MRILRKSQGATVLRGLLANNNNNNNLIESNNRGDHPQFKIFENRI